MHVPLFLRSTLRKGFQVKFIRKFSKEKIGEAPQATLVEKKIIKPMHPTQFCGNIHKLSLLDQISDGRYMPMAFFFTKLDILSSNTKNNISQLIKNSLAKVLVSYYPFAGIKLDDTHIHCNDQGVEFQEVEFDCSMSEILDRSHNSLNRLLFSKIPGDLCDPNCLISIQLNHFDCGGIALGLCMTHTLGDGWSLAKFMKDWSSLSRGAHVKPCPQFIGSSIFPPLDHSLPIKEVKAPEGHIMVKRYVFSASKILSLKEKILSSNYSKGPKIHPTSIEAIATLIFQSAAYKSNKPSVLLSTSDIRRQINKEIFPQNYIGNASIPFYIAAENKEEMELQRMVGEFREEKERISSAYKNITSREKVLPTTMESIGKVVDLSSQFDKIDLYVLSCVTKLQVEEIDFGWGGPKRVILPMIPHVKNFIAMLDNLRGDGIEVSVQLEEEKMHAFESAQEILEFSSPI